LKDIGEKKRRTRSVSRTAREHGDPLESERVCSRLFDDFATLCVEVLDTRLLSVMAWYHLSFFAVSTAMFDSAGACAHPAPNRRQKGATVRSRSTRCCSRFDPDLPPREPVVRIPSGTGELAVAALFVSTIALAIPFSYVAASSRRSC
jgi:hypothetical protein